MTYPWQTEDWQHFLQSKHRLPNAWLLSGAAGIGKCAFAKQMAQALLCDKREQTASLPCGVCQSCHWFIHGTHPDFRHLSPPAADNQTMRRLPQIQIEAVRAVLDFVHLTAHRAAGLRVILLEPAESLNHAAANALLKGLEEPPDGVVFLLVSHQPHRLPPTIRSRCRIFLLTRPSQAAALDWLRQHQVQHAESELAFHGGVPLFNYDPEQVKLRHQFIHGLGQLQLENMIKLAETVSQLPLSIPLNWLTKWLHDLANLSLTGKISYYPNQEQVFITLAARVDYQQLMTCQDTLNRLAPFGQHTLNTQLQLEAVLMEYLNIFVPPSLRGRCPHG